MADEETKIDDAELEVFDSTKKKKKKKPKEENEDEAAAELSEKVKDLSVEDGSEGPVPLDFGKKKKKKKPKEGAGEGEEGDGAGEDGEGAGDKSGEVEGGGGEPLVPLLKKKKKKKERTKEESELLDDVPEEKPAPAAGAPDGEKADEDEEDIPDDEGDMDEAAGEIVLGGDAPAKLPWEGTDRDYLYDELLGRVFDILRQNNPELAGDRRRTIMRPPQVLREGTKKTVFVNFMDLCKMMHRQPEHVMAFLLAELGTSGSLDGQQRLVVKGRFAPKNFEGLLRRYVTEYVMCQMCKSPDTILSKENRLHFVRCQQCGSHRSVSQIKAGFQARVKRRERTG